MLNTSKVSGYKIAIPILAIILTLYANLVVAETPQYLGKYCFLIGGDKMEVGVTNTGGNYFLLQGIFFQNGNSSALTGTAGGSDKKGGYLVTLNGTINNNVSVGLTSIQMQLDSSLNGIYWQLSHYAMVTKFDVYTKKTEDIYTKSGWEVEQRDTSVPEYKKGSVTLVSCN